MLKKVSSSFSGHDKRRRSEQAPEVLKQYCLSSQHTSYIPEVEDFRNFLEDTFDRGYGKGDIQVSLAPDRGGSLFNVYKCQEVNGRWKYYAPRELRDDEIK